MAIAGVFGAILLWKSSSNGIGSLNDAIRVRADATAIVAKEARAKQLVTMADGKAEEVSALRKDIAASKRRVMEIHDDEPLGDKSDSEIALLFTTSGF